MFLEFKGVAGCEKDNGEMGLEEGGRLKHGWFIEGKDARIQEIIHMHLL